MASDLRRGETARATGRRRWERPTGEAGRSASARGSTIWLWGYFLSPFSSLHWGILIMTRILRMRMLRKRSRKQLEGNWDLREVTSYCELMSYWELKDMIFLCTYCGHFTSYTFFSLVSYLLSLQRALTYCCRTSVLRPLCLLFWCSSVEKRAVQADWKIVANAKIPNEKCLFFFFLRKRLYNKGDESRIKSKKKIPLHFAAIPNQMGQLGYFKLCFHNELLYTKNRFLVVLGQDFICMWEKFQRCQWSNSFFAKISHILVN